jgi:hypothetical protein
MSQALLTEPKDNSRLTKFERFLINHKGKLFLASFFVAFVVTRILMPSGSMPKGPQSMKMQTAHALQIALFSYANDHEGKYPTGKSSTEIFQHLIDQNYISDATIFYFKMDGKTEGTGNKLKPENVCWDVTNGVLSDDSDDLPTVFATGYKIDYVPNGKAHPQGNASPEGLPVAYKSGAAQYLRSSEEGLVIIKSTFDPKGRTYQQLTPDGPLP